MTNPGSESNPPRAYLIEFSGTVKVVIDPDTFRGEMDEDDMKTAAEQAFYAKISLGHKGDVCIERVVEE